MKQPPRDGVAGVPLADAPAACHSSCKNMKQRPGGKRIITITITTIMIMLIIIIIVIIIIIIMILIIIMIIIMIKEEEEY